MTGSFWSIQGLSTVDVFHTEEESEGTCLILSMGRPLSQQGQPQWDCRASDSVWGKVSTRILSRYLVNPMPSCKTLVIRKVKSRV